MINITNHIRLGKDLTKKDLVEFIKSMTDYLGCVSAVRAETRVSEVSWKYQPKVTDTAWQLDKEIARAESEKEWYENLSGDDLREAFLTDCLEVRETKAKQLAEYQKRVELCDILEKYVEGLRPDENSWVCWEVVGRAKQKVSEIKFTFTRPDLTTEVVKGETVDEWRSRKVATVEAELQRLRDRKTWTTETTMKWNKELKELYNFIDDLGRDN